MISVIGDVMLDRTHWVRAARLSAESEGSVIYTAGRTEQQLGGAANVAVNVHGLRQPVRLTGAIGRDGPGITIERMCTDLYETPRSQFQARFILAEESTLKERIRTESTLLLRMDRDGRPPLTGRAWQAWTGSPASATNIEPVFDNAVRGVKQFCLVDYGRGFLEQVLRCKPIVAAIEQSPRPVVIEPCRAANLHNFKFKRQVLKLNIRQSEEWICTATRPRCDTLDPWRAYELPRYRELAAELYKALVKAHVPHEVVFITLGAGGVLAFRNNSGEFQWLGARDAKDRPVVDVCGAGDTATAVITCALASTESGLGDQWVENALSDLVDWCGRAVSVVGNYIPR